MFLILYKKRLKNIKLFKNYIYFWFTYIGLLVFYTKLTHLTQKLKKLKLDRICSAKLNSNFFTELTHLVQKFKNLDYMRHVAQN